MLSARPIQLLLDTTYLRAFKLNSSINIYTQFGLDIGVLPSYGIFGISVSISQDGTTFAVGAAIKGPYSYTKDNMTILTDNFPAGHIRVFKEVSTLSSYAQVGSDIYGERYLDILDSSMLSARRRVIKMRIVPVYTSTFLYQHVRHHHVDQQCHYYLPLFAVLLVFIAILHTRTQKTAVSCADFSIYCLIKNNCTLLLAILFLCFIASYAYFQHFCITYCSQKSK